jgi:hypothetical protein
MSINVDQYLKNMSSTIYMIGQFEISCYKSYSFIDLLIAKQLGKIEVNLHSSIIRVWKLYSDSVYPA